MDKTGKEKAKTTHLKGMVKAKDDRVEAAVVVVGIRTARGDRSAYRRLTSASPVITIEARRALLDSNDSGTYLKAVNSTTAEVVAAIKLRISAEVSNSLAEQPH